MRTATDTACAVVNEPPHSFERNTRHPAPKKLDWFSHCGLIHLLAIRKLLIGGWQRIHSVGRSGFVRCDEYHPR